MKKFLFLGLAAMMAFTSCTKDETLATAQNGAIGFDVAADKATRSNVDPSITTANIDNFAVYGWMKDASNVGGKVFEDELVTKNGGAWSYQNTQYWTRNTYYFAALAPSNDRNWTVATQQSESGIGVVTFENKDAAQDLLYWAGISENKGGESENAPVGIFFKHLLSKVKFSFVNNFDNALTSIKVSNVQITNAYTKGTLDLTLADWWTKPEWKCEGEQTFAFGNATATENGVAEAIAQYAELESDKEILLFPAADKTYKVTFTVNVLNGEAVAGEYTHNVELKTTFNMGFSYDIKATLNAMNVDPENPLKPIEFEVKEVKEWMQPDENVALNYTIYDNQTITEDTKLTQDGVIEGTLNIKDANLDGAGYTLTAAAVLTDNALTRLSGDVTISNVTLNGENKSMGDKGIRNIYITKGGNYTFDKIISINNTYALNTNTTEVGTITITNSTLEGWTSYGSSFTVTMDNVKFEIGASQKTFRPHGVSTLKNCSFEEGFVIWLDLLGDRSITFENCTYGGQPLTEANLTDVPATATVTIK